MILLADVIIGQIKVCLFCYLHAGMTEDFTEGENIHSVHKAPLVCLSITKNPETPCHAFRIAPPRHS